MTELHFDSLAALAAEAEAQKAPISAVVLAAQARSTERSQQALYEQMRQNLAVMRESVRQGLAPGVKSASGLSGGDAHRMAAAFAGGGAGLCGPALCGALAKAVAVAEWNAAMGRIVAAPTAGLHFTPELRAQMASAGVEWAEVTLHVGYGTFSPVRCEDIREHVMHEEFVEVPQATVDAIGKAKAEGRPVIAVGTTSARTLEGVAGAHGGELTAHQGWINCFIWPGYRFHVLDGLITNFHLPESTLLMLVSALTGRERMLETYTEAVKMEYRFFSYGDAMLIR